LPRIRHLGDRVKNMRAGTYLYGLHSDGAGTRIDYNIDLNVFNALGTQNGASYGELYNGAVSTDGAN
jgi:hypothetical protein